jgi:DNA-binding transcriptional LysR family regulator
MKQLSLDTLRTFVSVIELGGYAKAGDFLGRSQPAISLQIKKLESQLNRKLFTKVG